jgi:hypothetical protein
MPDLGFHRYFGHPRPLFNIAEPALRAPEAARSPVMGQATGALKRECSDFDLPHNAAAPGRGSGHANSDRYGRTC